MGRVQGGEAPVGKAADGDRRCSRGGEGKRVRICTIEMRIGDVRGLDEAHVIIAACGGKREQILPGDEPTLWHPGIRHAFECIAETYLVSLLPGECCRHTLSAHFDSTFQLHL